MHSWKDMVDTLEETDRPQTIGFQADMAHTLLYTMGYNAPKSRLLPAKYDWKNKGVLDEALKKMTDALRPWTIDFHVAQNDGTVKGLGYHDKTGHHCVVDDKQWQAQYHQARRLLAARRQWRTDQGLPPHLLGRLHVPP